MPRTKETARRLPPKPYDHTKPRPCCIMSVDRSQIRFINEKLDVILEVCTDILTVADGLEHADAYEVLRYSKIFKAIKCVQKLAEHSRCMSEVPDEIEDSSVDNS